MLDAVGGSVRAANVTDWSFRAFCLHGAFLCVLSSVMKPVVELINVRK